MKNITKGKWNVQASISGKHRPYVYAEKGMPGFHAIVEGEHYGIAIVAGETELECRDNARLIATAPELAEALRRLLRADECPPGEKTLEEAVDAMANARAVLAKL